MRIARRFFLLAAASGLTVSSVLAQAPATRPAATTAMATRAESTTVRRSLEMDDLLNWKSIRGSTVTNDGKWFGYQLAPNEGESEVILRRTSDDKEMRFPVGENSNPGLTFSENSQYALFTIAPTKREAERLRRERKPVQNQAALVNLATGDVKKFEKVRRATFSGERGAWVALYAYAPEAAGGSAGGAGATPPTGGRGGGGGPPPRPQGADLLLHEIATGQLIPLGNVSDFAFDKTGEWLAWTVEARDQLGNGVQLFNTTTRSIRSLDAAKATFTRLTWSEDGKGLAVLRGAAVASDTTYSLVMFTDLAAPTPTKNELDPSKHAGFPAGMKLSANRAPRWSEDRTAVFFGIQDAKAKEPTPARDSAQRADSGPQRPGAAEARATDSPNDERPQLVIWHYLDPRLQRAQELQENADRGYNYLSMYRIADKKVMQLATDSMRTVTVAPKDRWAIGVDASAYELQTALDGRRLVDIYTIDLQTGARRKIRSKTGQNPLPSPDGARLLYYDDGHYFTYDLATGTSRNITQNVPTSFINTEDDHNVSKPPIPPMGWSKDGSAVLLFDNWDVWKVPATGGTAVNLTVNGKKEGIRYQRRYSFDPEERGIDLTKPLYFAAYGEWTKKEGLARVDPGKSGVTMKLWGDARIGVVKARKADTFLYTQQTVVDFPNYYVTDASLVPGRKITDANPQQRNVAWSAGAKLIDYTSAKGAKLQAAMYLPANYEAGKSYPTIVYIYEKRSQMLNQYTSPNATSAFNPAVYTSRGYVVLQPDIVYTLNDPGMSAVWCVVPAVEAAIATGIVDRDRVGIHGHSWGGYQTAFLVTQTKMFKSAVAGAALTNMVSMYGSVYWNSGTADGAIFESSQGRFLGGYWDHTDAYIRNSPVFHATKVETPLLLLHNDQDGAVDFNQGLEYYNVLRRMGKEVAMLQYVGENHGVSRPANQKDYTIRMREFFDHHLKGAPKPDWLKEGVPRLKMEEHLKERAKLLKAGPIVF
jgi:dipeptidyl aminopeptidase/acylaminoacyl peptidase